MNPAFSELWGEDPKKAGARLRQAREAKPASQRSLQTPGCSPAYVSRIEAGDRTPSPVVLEWLAEELDVSARWLATGNGPKDRPHLVVDYPPLKKVYEHRRPENRVLVYDAETTQVVDEVAIWPVFEDDEPTHSGPSDALTLIDHLIKSEEKDRGIAAIEAVVGA